MFTTVVSSTTISWAVASTARIPHRRVWCGLCSADAPVWGADAPVWGADAPVWGADGGVMTVAASVEDARLAVLVGAPAAGARSVAVMICSLRERESAAPFHHSSTIRSR